MFIHVKKKKNEILQVYLFVFIFGDLLYTHQAWVCLFFSPCINSVPIRTTGKSISSLDNNAQHYSALMSPVM